MNSPRRHMMTLLAASILFAPAVGTAGDWRDADTRPNAGAGNLSTSSDPFRLGRGPVDHTPTPAMEARAEAAFFGSADGLKGMHIGNNVYRQEGDNVRVSFTNGNMSNNQSSFLSNAFTTAHNEGKMSDGDFAKAMALVHAPEGQRMSMDFQWNSQTGQISDVKTRTLSGTRNMTAEQRTAAASHTPEGVLATVPADRKVIAGIVMRNPIVRDTVMALPQEKRTAGAIAAAAPNFAMSNTLKKVPEGERVSVLTLVAAVPQPAQQRAAIIVRSETNRANLNAMPAAARAPVLAAAAESSNDHYVIAAAQGPQAQAAIMASRPGDERAAVANVLVAANRTGGPGPERIAAVLTNTDARAAIVAMPRSQQLAAATLLSSVPATDLNRAVAALSNPTTRSEVLSHPPASQIDELRRRMT